MLGHFDQPDRVNTTNRGGTGLACIEMITVKAREWQAEAQ
jgi:hypothetical protein